MMSGLSFKFAKSKETKQLGVGAAELAADVPLPTEPQVESIDGEFVLKKKKAKVEELVIPLITKNRWCVEELKKQDPVKAELVTLEESELEKAAKEALMKDSKILSGELESEGGPAAGGTIPLLYKNQVPVGFETEGRLDVALRPDESAEADYDQVPIEAYGMAMLRGMGFKEEEGIGLTHKASVKQKIPELRPKGLGLGADKALVMALKNAKTGGAALLKKDEDKTLRLGAAVVITSRGPHKGMYGKVSAFDEDNSRVLVKLALGGVIASVPTLGATVVGAKEYEAESKCINKDKFDSYKAAEAAKHAAHTVDDDPLAITDGDFSANGKSRKKRSRKESPEPQPKRPPQTPWLRADLRVRIVDEGHKFSLEKVKILDVVSESACTCVTDSGLLLEGMRQSQLETVIPRGEPPLLVMIVRGKHKGEVGEMLRKDKKRCLATLQLSRRKEKIVEAGFDDICQFVGDLAAYES